jgi:uncharacterized damage-inducible protein DinB
VKYALRTCGLVCAVLLIAAPKPVSAQSASIQAEMLKDWTGLKDTIVKIANEMPEDKYSYKSTPAQRDYGAQVVHIAQVNMAFLRAFGGKTPAPTIDMKATGKAATMKALADSFDYGIALIKEQTDQTMLETVQAPFIGPLTRARVVTFLIGHTWDIYGQMAVYLRLNDKVPPASQRP